MSEFNDKFESLDLELQTERYQRLAHAALCEYALPPVTPVFIRHNGGITYRLEVEEGTPRYLLKIAQPVGESGAVPPKRLQRVMEWLEALAREGNVTVPKPITNRRGYLLTAVNFDDLSEPFHCTVQRWLEGEHIRGAFTTAHMYRTGAMMAHLHDHSSRWTPRRGRTGLRQDESWLRERIATLRTVVGLGILCESEWKSIETAVSCIADFMKALDQSGSYWGAVHGDLHHQNLLFYKDSVRPIDFGDFRIAHYPYDLGVVLYHIMYLNDMTVRQALLDGYRSVREVPDGVALWPEAFLCAAALSNLSFQVTIASQRGSEHFARNVRECANSFCRKLAAGNAFVER